MQLNRVKVHKHLGMKLDYSTVGQVKITMLEYTDEILDTFDKTYPMGGGTQSSFAPDIIFKVEEECKMINAKQAVDFHHLVAKIVFAIKRASTKNCTAI